MTNVPNKLSKFNSMFKKLKVSINMFYDFSITHCIQIKTNRNSADAVCINTVKFFFK